MVAHPAGAWRAGLRPHHLHGAPVVVGWGGHHRWPPPPWGPSWALWWAPAVYARPTRGSARSPPPPPGTLGGSHASAGGDGQCLPWATEAAGLLGLAPCGAPKADSGSLGRGYCSGGGAFTQPPPPASPRREGAGQGGRGSSCVTGWPVTERRSGGRPDGLWA